MPRGKPRLGNPGNVSIPTLLPARDARRAAILKETLESHPIDMTAGVTAESGGISSRATSPASDTGNSSCESMPEASESVLTRSIQDWWALAEHDIPDNWTDELSSSDRAKLDRMQLALGLPDSRAMLVHLIRWLVVGHKTAWLAQPLGKGVEFWLANVAI